MTHHESTGAAQSQIWIRVIAAALVVALVGGPSAGALAGQPDCLQVRKRVVVSAYGYDHLVVLTSHCRVAQTCKVTTSANRDGVTATVAPGEEIEVTTYVGSPASSFTVAVDCHDS